MNGRRYRQVHLDFHTSAGCENVGADFDPEIFAETVRMGRVDSMTVFAKCHHGFSYYPTEVGTKHPNLVVPDLMGDQLHPRGVLDPAVYRLLEHSFGRVEELEPFNRGELETCCTIRYRTCIFPPYC